MVFLTSEIEPPVLPSNADKKLIVNKNNQQNVGEYYHYNSNFSMMSVGSSVTKSSINVKSRHAVEMENIIQEFKDCNGKIHNIPKLKWQEHAGGNRFFCNGRIIMSKQCSIFLLTVFLIVFTMSLFCVFDLPYLTERVSIVLPIIAGILFVLVMSSLFKTSFSDPGILPRASICEVIEWDRQQNNKTGVNNSEWTPPRTKVIQIYGQNIKLKYCFTCCLFRPPRSSHCSICDNCILSFDHHCPWVGNCVGLRNYRYFYFFISILSMLDFFIGGCVMVHLVMLTRDKGTFFNAIKESPPSIFTALINFISIWSILGLSGFHTYLLSINQTTNEDIKGTFSPKIRPLVRNPYYSQNFLKEIYKALCGPERPSLLERRGIVSNNHVVTANAEFFNVFTGQNQMQSISTQISMPKIDANVLKNHSQYHLKNQLSSSFQTNNDIENTNNCNAQNVNKVCSSVVPVSFLTKNAAVQCVSTTAAGCGASVAPKNLQVTIDDCSDDGAVQQ